MKDFPYRAADIEEEGLVDWSQPVNKLIFAMILQAISDLRPNVQKRVGRTGFECLKTKEMKYLVQGSTVEAWFDEFLRDFVDIIAIEGKEEELYQRILKAKNAAKTYKKKFLYTKERSYYQHRR